MANRLSAGYRNVIERFLTQRWNLPTEISSQIVDCLCGSSTQQSQRYFAAFPNVAVPNSYCNQNDPSVPPANDSSPIMRLPAELRRNIFCSSLLAREIPVLPLCQEHFNARQEDKEGAKHSRTSDLMVINKTIKNEITTMLYEERTFVIHVHEGIRNAGIEFLDTGRQPLQYQDEITDSRFRRFQHGDEFGLNRVKKIKIIVFPSTLEDSISNHVPINTFFICSALSRLLDRGDGADGKNKIHRLSIEFAERTVPPSTFATSRCSSMKPQKYWWDPETGCPRASSWHSITNVEIALRGFSALRSHNAKIQLPKLVEEHPQTIAFAQYLEGIIKSSAPSSDLDEDFWNYQINAARPAMEQHVINILYNGSGERHHVADLTADDFQEDLDDSAVKHDLSPVSKHQGGKKKRLGRLAVYRDAVDASQVYRVRFNEPNVATRQWPVKKETLSPTQSCAYLSGAFSADADNDDEDEAWRAAGRASIEAHEEQQPGNFVFPASTGRVLRVNRRESRMTGTPMRAPTDDASAASKKHLAAHMLPRINRATLSSPRATYMATYMSGGLRLGSTLGSAAPSVSPPRGMHSEVAALSREREKRMRDREMRAISEQQLQRSSDECFALDEYNAARAFAKLRKTSGGTSISASPKNDIARWRSFADENARNGVMDGDK